MQMRSLLPYLLTINVMAYHYAHGDDTTIGATTANTTAQADATANAPAITSFDDANADDADNEGCSNEDNESTDVCTSWEDSYSDDGASWIPTFTPLTTIPTYQEIVQCTAANDANFATQLAAATQALQTYLSQCLTNGTIDEQQVVTLVDTIKQVYRTYIRQSAFLAFAKAQLLQNEAQYQAYQTQLTEVQKSIQQAAQQASNAWLAVAAGDGALADAFTASQNAVTAIGAAQSEIDQINVQIAALLALLASNEVGQVGNGDPATSGTTGPDIVAQ